MNYYDPSAPELIETPQTVQATRKVVWSAFPRRLISLGLAGGHDRWWAYEQGDKLIPFNSPENDPGFQAVGNAGFYPVISETDIMRQQDEYCEWFVHKNAEGKITRVDFTSEAPEYYQSLWDLGDEGRAELLRLYHTYVSPDVQLEDLHGIDIHTQQDVYNYMNKWNGAQGCMHLQCPPNSLSAEVNLACFSSVPRYSPPADHVIEDGGELIACAQYGRATRNSDPHIGEQVNVICRAGFKVTLTNPVALYQNSFDATPIRKPDGSALKKDELAQLIQCTRGDIETNHGLRHTIQCPEDWGFVLGDMTISGQKIRYGGQLAELMLIQLTAQAINGQLTFEGGLSTLPILPPATPTSGFVQPPAQLRAMEARVAPMAQHPQGVHSGARIRMRI